jgi:4-amino-4-deoxy-L-arabinose transferase-like glycosyltransferase
MAHTHGRNDRSLRIVAPILIVLVGGVVPVIIAKHFGALGIPKNDDWSYTLSAFRFADSGKLTGNNWGTMSLIGQLVLALPVIRLFGHSIVALDLEIGALGVVGLLAVFDLAKRVISPRKALFVALMVALGPMWASLSVSFMTDVPAFALAMVSLALGARAVRPDGINARFLWPSLAVGLVAFTVREYALVAPLAVVCCALLVERRTRPRFVRMVAALLGTVIVAGVFFAWRRSLPGFQSMVPLRPHLSSIKLMVSQSLQSAVLIGLLVTPAVLLADPRLLVRKAWDRAPRTTAGVVLITTAALIAENATRLSQGFIGPGNYVLPNGTYGSALIPGTRSELLPTWLLATLAIVGLASAVVIFVACVPLAADVGARLRTTEFGAQSLFVPVILALAACGYVVTIVVPLATSLSFWDRYVLPLLPIVGILVLFATTEVVTSQTGRIAGCTAMVALAAFGAIYAANTASYDGTTWRLASRAAEIAGAPQRVDGGFVWNNYQSGVFVFNPFTFKYERKEPVCITIRTEAHPRAGVETVVPAARVWGPMGAQTWVETQMQGHC